MEILPPEFYSFLKLSAFIGFFSAGVMTVGICYKLYKKFFGEEKAKKYRKYFFWVNIPLFFVFLYIFITLF
ncbi:hypothetical protein A2159_01015 [Candidatus Woesebacteria bacterium RBG_13_34_9]|uniref:Uncharacterized protein n=1 Tax=Candidatus Woesebacteria bacterium RBG_13_34_9 TaxID=1802477 RepID=A0A1F7X3N7_9BACT|nr:MAG: hypothetical protein A2159_01015 [Candidatus Woesebacteria bacterium RBG_13_34_9]